MAINLEKLRDLIRNKMSEYFGEQFEDVELTAQNEVVLNVHRDAIVGVCTKLRDDPDFQFSFLSYHTAIDNSALGTEPRYTAIYELYSINRTHRVRVRAGIPEDDAAIESVTSVWPGADWMEREAFDMFGIIYNNHPDLRRILMPEDWEGHPLRKDFPLGGVKSFYFKRSSEPRAGEPENLVPRIREQRSDI